MFEVDIIRVLCAFFVGYGLTLSGSLSQLTTNNSLASPSTLGMDGLSVVSLLVAQGLIVTKISSLSSEFLSLIVFSIFFIILAAIFLSLRPRDLWQYLNMKQIILLGLAFNLMVGAIFSVIQFMFIALNYEFPTGLWFGHFKHAQLSNLIILVVPCVMIWVYCLKNAAKFNAINLGVFVAQGIGIDVEKFQKINLLLSLLLTGIVVSFFGVFSLLGLVLPHVLRSLTFFKTDMRSEILYGPLLGGLLIAVIDLACYNFVFYGAELPVGMISSVVGAFALILVLLRSSIRI